MCPSSNMRAQNGTNSGSRPSGTTDSNAICRLAAQVQVLAEDHHELRGEHEVAAAEHAHPEHVFAEMRILAQDLEQHAEAERLGAPDRRVLFGEQRELAAHARARDTTRRPAGRPPRRRRTASASRCTAVSSVQAASAAATATASELTMTMRPV